MNPSFYPIQLSINPDGWRRFVARKADSAFRGHYDKVMRRDRFTCQFCGFQAKQYQEVINLDQDYRNNQFNNLATACCFCTQCFFLDAVGTGDTGGGTLVYLPEMTQTHLNGFCHVLFCAMANATAYRSDAQGIYRSLKLRSQGVEDHYGEGMGKPAMLARMLVELQAHKKPVTTDILKNLRLLPSRTKFNTQIRAWAAAALEELPSEGS